LKLLQRVSNVNASPAASSWLQHQQQGLVYYTSDHLEEASVLYRAVLHPGF
jgi:hypothetical protein